MDNNTGSNSNDNTSNNSNDSSANENANAASSGAAEDSSVKKWSGDIKSRLNGSLTTKPYEALLVLWVAHGVFPVCGAIVGIVMYFACEKYPPIHSVTKKLLNLYILWMLAWLIGGFLCFVGGILTIFLIGIPIFILGFLIATAGLIHFYVNVIMGIVAAVKEEEFKPWLSLIQAIPEDEHPDSGSKDKQEA